MKFQLDFKDTHQRLLLGVPVTVFLIIQLADRIVAGGTGAAISWDEFLTVDNLMFCFNMLVLCLVAWSLKGPNNRQLLSLWVLGLTIYLWLYYAPVDYFLGEQRNIYGFFIWTFLSYVPFYLLVHYRIELVSTLPLWLQKIFGLTAGALPARTKLELKARRYFKFFMGFEFIACLFFLAYGWLYRVPFDGSIYATIVANQQPDFYEAYFFIQNFCAFYTVFLFCMELRRDLKEPDNLRFNLSAEQKRLLVATAKARSHKKRRPKRK